MNINNIKTNVPNASNASNTSNIKSNKISPKIIIIALITIIILSIIIYLVICAINYNKVKCLSKLSNLFYLIHAHGNNYSPIINGIPDVIELTYVNKNYFTTVPRSNKKSLPSKLDFPNKKANDVDLNFYPFVKK